MGEVWLCALHAEPHLTVPNTDSLISTLSLGAVVAVHPFPPQNPPILGVLLRHSALLLSGRVPRKFRTEFQK